MMRYIKNVQGRSSLSLRNKSFEEIKVLYDKVKKSIETFVAIGSEADEQAIKEMNEKAAGIKKAQGDQEKTVKESPSSKEESRKRKFSPRLKQIARKKKAESASDDELRKSLKIVDFLSDSKFDEESLEKKSHIIDWRVIKESGKEFHSVIRSNGFVRRFEKITEVLHIYDRDDIYRLYDLVYDRWSKHILQGIEYEILGDLLVTMDSIREEF